MSMMRERTLAFCRLPLGRRPDFGQMTVAVIVGLIVLHIAGVTDGGPSADPAARAPTTPAPMPRPVPPPEEAPETEKNARCVVLPNGERLCETGRALSGRG